MRTTISRNHVLIAVAIVAAGVAMVMTMRQMKPQPLPVGGQVYFYDLDAGQLFAAAESELPPITSPAAGRSVRAHVYTCGECGDVSAGDVVYLETLTDDARAQLSGELSSRETAAVLDAGLHVAAMPPAGEQPRWVPAATNQGMALQNQAAHLCDGGPAQVCSP
jgi:hypothetical protein